jgi:hypothetical protein
MSSKKRRTTCELFGGRKDGLRFSWGRRLVEKFAFTYGEHDNEPRINTPGNEDRLLYYTYQDTVKSVARYVYSGSNRTECETQK